MKTVPFKQVLLEVAQWNDGSQADEITAEAACTAVVFINSAMEMCWSYSDWPETLVCEARTPSDRLISYEQTSKHVIGEPYDVYSANPYSVNARVKPLPWTQTADGVLLLSEVTGDVWLEYQRQAPVFTSTIWDVAAAYVAGQLVFDDERVEATGECYRARSAITAGTVPTDNTKWERMELPHLLRQAVVQGAVAGLKNADSEHGTAAVKLKDMEDLLEQKVLNLSDRSGRVKKFKRVGR